MRIQIVRDMDKDFFEIKDMSIQQQIEPNFVTIILSIDLVKFPTAQKFFIDLYDSRRKFDVFTIKYDFFRSYIKSIDLTEEVLGLIMSCDSFKESNISERRLDVIDNILNKS